jgi:hypothetical protein
VLNIRITIAILTLAASLVVTTLSQAADASYSGKAITKGGSKPFCKGSTTLSAKVTGLNIVLALPMAAGGTATIKGTMTKSGAFHASGNRFTMTGKLAGKSLVGSWKGPSCFGTFSIRS